MKKVKFHGIVYWFACFLASTNVVDAILWFAEGGFALNPYYIARGIMSICAWVVMILSDKPTAKKFMHLAISCACVLTAHLLMALVAIFIFASLL